MAAEKTDMCETNLADDDFDIPTVDSDDGENNNNDGAAESGYPPRTPSPEPGLRRTTSQSRGGFALSGDAAELQQRFPRLKWHRCVRNRHPASARG
eukprot:CAMPEP_0174850292 /NCGR_PEP_ID=MMETSP1114-20130205/19149_1 /TAXON_ID=312471 /ORGANISM="Neobodo designis, Strain CCAP 1951/1" /LENGTH=95 /DNA_ID=CAMNT_0016084741 /DNA_START=59 /DNA_END=346 /DNA_ORIENTATION=+